MIKELLTEQGWVPGRWYPGEGEPVSDKEIETMDGAGGMGLEETDYDTYSACEESGHTFIEDENDSNHMVCKDCGEDYHVEEFDL